MKKLLGIVVLSLLCCNVAFTKIIKLYDCYNITSNEFDVDMFEYYEYNINIDNSTIIYKHAFTDKTVNNPKNDNPFTGKKMNKFSIRAYKIINVSGNQVSTNISRDVSGLPQRVTVDIIGKTVMLETWGQDDQPFDTYVHSCKSNYTPSENDSEKEAKGSSGTAFFINNRGHLLTNNHVVSGCTLSKISYKNREYDTKLIATDKTLDLALLKAELKPKTFINFSNNEAKKLNTIYVAGYPLGKGLSDDLKISSGIVSSLKGFEDNSNEIQIDAPINPGNSGGPIINENGDLVAIAVSGMAKDQTEGINFGIKSSAAERFLKSNNINIDKSSYSRSKNKDQLLNILEEGTVYTYCN
jgi:S1-C subfamily serine protease